MFGSTALDVVIGLVFVFLLYSLLASILQEIFSTWMGLRARILKKALVRMLNDRAGEPAEPVTAGEHIAWFFKVTFCGRLKTFYDTLILRDAPNGTPAKAFYEHPLVKYLGESAFNSKPAYLSSQNFSKVMLDLLAGLDKKPGEDLRDDIENTLQNGSLSVDKLKLINPEAHPSVLKAKAKKEGLKAAADVHPFLDSVQVQNDTIVYLKSLWADAQGDVDRFKALLENWFDDTMERSTGWYKQYTQFFLFLIGMAVAITFNVDSIRIAQKLAKDPKLRQQVVERADAFVKEHPNLTADLKKMKETVRTHPADTAAKRSADSLAILKERHDTLTAQADRLIRNDIQNLNTTLGLGYDKLQGGWFSCHTLKRVGHAFCSREGWTRSAGWILTALAISLGAPFWFDLLNKLMQLRGTLKNNGGDDDKNPKKSPAHPVNRKG